MTEITTFVYDGNGVRVKKIDPDGSVTYYVRALQAGLSIYEVLTTTTGITKTSYYYTGAQRVAMRVTTGVSTTVTYLHGDHLGSTSLTTDADGQMMARVLYYPYGEERYTEGTLQTDYGYTGQRKNGYLDTYSMGARDYDPRLGRWLSADTIVPNPANPQSLNRYAYVRNNPLRYTDPTGHTEEDEGVPLIFRLIIVALAFMNGADITTEDGVTTISGDFTSFTVEEAYTGARVVTKEVGEGEHYMESHEQFYEVSKLVAWTMRNRIEIGDPCVGCTKEGVMLPIATTYKEAYSGYEPYYRDKMPEKPNVLAVVAVVDVWTEPAGTPNPVNDAEYILGKGLCEQAACLECLEAEGLEYVLYVDWMPPGEGASKQGIYFFTECPGCICPQCTYSP